MFIVDNNEMMIRRKHVEMILRKQWMFEQLFREGLVELLDVEEEESAMIAVNIAIIADSSYSTSRSSTSPSLNSCSNIHYFLRIISTCFFLIII